MQHTGANDTEMPETPCVSCGIDKCDWVEKMDGLKEELVWTENELQKSKTAYETLKLKCLDLEHVIIRKDSEITDLTHRIKQLLTDLTQTIDETIGIIKNQTIKPTTSLGTKASEVIDLDSDGETPSGVSNVVTERADEF